MSSVRAPVRDALRAKTMEAAILRLAIVTFLVTGLSHIIQPQLWVQFFIEIRNLGRTGSFILGFIYLPFGALIVAFHNVWHGLPLIFTLVGYSLVLKSLGYFVWPNRALKTLSRVTLERSWEFVVAGVFSVALSGLLILVLISKS
jgi:uncharacterized protein YjeT (DUF2065 family)